MSIKPVLKPWEWDLVLYGQFFEDSSKLGDDQVRGVGNAAAILYCEPEHGFTWADVDLLRDRVMERSCDDTGLVNDLADRIAALLPPRPKSLTR